MLFRVVILAALLPLAFLGFGYSGTADAASGLTGVVGIAASCLSGVVFHSIASHISHHSVVAGAGGCATEHVSHENHKHAAAQTPAVLGGLPL